MNKKKSILCFFIICCIVTTIFSFDWPQLVNGSDNFYTYFGQERKSNFSNGLVFSQPSEVKSADSGKVIAILEDSISDMGWFSSPLGNTVILSHPNELLTVYGNLEEIYIDKKTDTVEAGQILGISNSTNWEKGMSCLEFQVMDLKLKTVINPLILMGTKPVLKPYRLTDIVGVNRTGQTFELSKTRNVTAGMYTLYIKRDLTNMPFTTTVLINGAIVETITYDVMKEVEGRLVIQGKKQYTFNTIYPDENRMLLAEVILPRGKNTVTITIADILGKEQQLQYILDVK